MCIFGNRNLPHEKSLNFLLYLLLYDKGNGKVDVIGLIPVNAVHNFLLERRGSESLRGIFMLVVMSVGVATHATDSGILLQEEVSCIKHGVLLNYIQL